MQKFERFKLIAKEWADTSRLVAGILAIVLGVKGLIFPIFASIKPESIITIHEYANIRIRTTPGHRPILTVTFVYRKHRDCYNEAEDGTPVRFMQNGMPLGGSLIGVVPLPRTIGTTPQRANFHLLLPLDYNLEEPSTVHITSIYRCGNSPPTYYYAKPIEVPPLGSGIVR